MALVNLIPLHLEAITDTNHSFNRLVNPAQEGILSGTTGNTDAFRADANGN
jgi:hypothetical protein